MRTYKKIASIFEGATRTIASSNLEAKKYRAGSYKKNANVLGVTRRSIPLDGTQHGNQFEEGDMNPYLYKCYSWTDQSARASKTNP